MPSKQEEHRRKKQIQTSISNYLQPCQQTTDRNPTSSPELPDDTQAMLISVGMRVRKSVPEGYKTHKTASRSNGSSHKSEQTCALHNVGGFSQQKLVSRDKQESPMSSQNTASSQESQNSTVSDTRKRMFEEEQAEEDRLDLDLLDMVDLTKDRPIARARNTLRQDADFDDAPFLYPRDKMDVD